MPMLGAAAWLGGLAAQLLPEAGLRMAGGIVVAIVAAGAIAWMRGRLPRSAALTALGVLLVAAAAGSVGLLRQAQLAHGPVAALARDGATVEVRGTVTSDPREIRGRFGDRVLVRMEVHTLTGRGTSYALAAPVLVLADASWRHAPLGATVRASGRLAPADGPDLAAVLSARGPPDQLAGPDAWWRGADTVRRSLRRSVEGRPADQRALVPALVDGDDAAVDPALADDFRVTGLTHLLAVSGTNLTLVVGFLMVLARWVGVRGRWLYPVGACGIAGFVMLARTEPSVLRAAVMGSVGLLAMGANGRQRGSRALGVAVVCLLLVDPPLATSMGFALSALATAGILLLAPGWRDALGRWLPRWLGEAVAVPAAAQLACTPLVAAISGQVSLVAVATNLVVAPAVGPATVLGLGGGLLGLLAPWAGSATGTLAAWSVAWIVLVARRGAGLPAAAVDWGTGAVPLVLLTLVCVGLAMAAPHLLRRRTTGLGCCLLLVLAVVVRPPRPGWPPDGWLMVACDVGQGDALVLRAGPGAGVVVDAGPDPAAVDACLDRLGLTSVPLVVLTHFHADHVDGLAGVLDGRRVGRIETTRLADPPDAAADVADLARGIGLVPSPAPYGVPRTVGDLTLQVLWPTPDSPTLGPGDGSTANNASVVLLVRVRGVRLLLCGDIEPEGQAELARTFPGLRVDVLKVPHHGSRYQDLDLLTSLGARLALVSVGVDNDYGHPAEGTLAALAATGARVLRTDLDGDLVVVERDGRLAAVTGP
jgi:competence protein ComEC